MQDFIIVGNDDATEGARSAEYKLPAEKKKFAKLAIATPFTHTQEIIKCSATGGPACSGSSITVLASPGSWVGSSQALQSRTASLREYCMSHIWVYTCTFSLV